jgi:hypothetical protein
LRSLIQTFESEIAEPAERAARVDALQKQHFGLVDVADAGRDPLLQQQVNHQGLRGCDSK